MSDVREALVIYSPEPAWSGNLRALALGTGLAVAVTLSLCEVAWTVGWDRTKLVDLTYELDEATIAWPTNRPFHRDKTAWGMTAQGYWYASGDFVMSEHAGTHIDAPVHFAQGRPSVDRIPVDHLIGPAVVVDVRAAVAKDADYRLRVEDLRNWEARHGSIPAGAIVVMRSGWGRHWPDRLAYLGSPTPEDVTTLHFPGFSREAAEFLTKERNIVGIGIDTASIDYGPSRDFIVHRIIGGAGLYGLENIAHLEQLPEAGALMIALPVKIRDGTGGPVRLIAVLP
ncbi:MAG TPA: cyclase family protein [Nitrospiraceae bacterium]|nr:cyclase family protein [Nitrospiraceae bacterium]